MVDKELSQLFENIIKNCNFTLDILEDIENRLQKIEEKVKKIELKLTKEEKDEDAQN